MSVTFQLKPTDRIRGYIAETEKLNAEIETEEEKVREDLSRKIFRKG